MNTPRKIKVLFFFFYVCAIFTVSVALWCFFSDGRYDQLISNIANATDPIIDIAIVLGAFLLYRKIEHTDKKVISYLLFASGFLFVCDSSFFTAVYIGKLSKVSAIDILAVPFLLWLIFLIVFFSQLIRARLLKISHFLILFFLCFLKDIAIIALYFSSSAWALSSFSFQGFYEVSSATLVLLLFDLVLLCLIYSNTRSIQYFLAGNIITLAGDTLIKYAYVTKKMHMLPTGDLFWLLGLLFMCFGLYFILAERSYKISDWFRKTTAIKTRIVFWTFGITIASFAIFLLLETLFSVVSKQIFVGLPFFFMTYAATVVVVAIFVGKTFEAPFKKLEANVRALMFDDDKSRVDHDFSTDEFRFLHRFILEAYEHKEDKNHAHKELAVIAARVAHDIRSPLGTLDTCLRYLSDVPEQYRVMLRSVSKEIKDIANNLLAQHRGKESTQDGSQIWLLAPVVESLISEKRMEYDKKNVELDSKITNMGLGAFSRFDITEMKRLLSNLINNAMEAFSPEKLATKTASIILSLGVKDDLILLTVKDNGSGIPPEALDKVLEFGVSLEPVQDQ